MKKNYYFFSGVLSMLTVIMTPIARGENWTAKGSSYVYTTPSSLVPSGIFELTYDDPASGVSVSGTSELISPECITVSTAGSFSGVSGISAVTATVYERKYTANGTLSGVLGDGAITSSNVEYYINDIQYVPYYDLSHTTFGKSDWVISISGGVTYTGTTYYYYQPSLFSGGRVEGDIHGEFHFSGTDATQHPLSQVEVTSINGNPSEGTYAIVWDPPTDYIVEIFRIHHQPQRNSFQCDYLL